MSELAIEQTPDVAEAAHEAASGQVVYITEHGQRLAAIVSPGLAAALEQLSADELDYLSAAVARQGRADLAALLEDLADRAAALESLAEPGEDVPWEQVKAENGL
jgi:hypothetical protein